VFDWPADGRLTIPMAGKVTGAYLLAQPEKPLDVVCTEEAAVITVPTSPPDPIASVVVASVGRGSPGAVVPNSSQGRDVAADG